LDIFPLEDPDATKEDKDTLLGKQFFLLERLLVDDCPEVRTIAIEGSCRVLHLFWEVIPSPIITKMLTKIIGDMSHDACNEVRLSTLNGIIYLLDNPHSHEVLKVLCPRLGHLMQDNVLTVRVAVADLLLRLNDVINFQFNKVLAFLNSLLFKKFLYLMYLLISSINSQWLPGNYCVSCRW
jgi:condensin-2 complex subunit G2